jgi:hypothetical protein
MSVQRLRAASPGPLSDKEIAELDQFLLEEEALDEGMDVCTLDGFLCALLSGPKLILPSEWMRWVWDMKEGQTGARIRKREAGAAHHRASDAARQRYRADAVPRLGTL